MAGPSQAASQILRIVKWRNRDMKIRVDGRSKYMNERISFYDAQYDYGDSHKTSPPIPGRSPSLVSSLAYRALHHADSYSLFFNFSQNIDGNTKRHSADEKESLLYEPNMKRVEICCCK